MDVLQPILVIDKTNRLDQLGEVLSDSGSVDDAEYKTGTKVSRPPTHSLCKLDPNMISLSDEPSVREELTGLFHAFIELRTLACFLSNNMSILNSKVAHFTII
ncbi:2996_t:CDS:2 [Paraglomus occultum]|uniref:2996_t:CDS:1 n=1 Tax=Paraglomus occultum TaxID=144539 RepID=A0A9N9BCE8_9GLOM|nr:2996_t:CDS:2 [Paraglomus occultum]